MLDLTRYANWPERLFDVLDTHRAAKFQWGYFDCVTLYADAVKAITKVDPLALYRPRSPWLTERAAMKALVKTGFSEMAGLVTAQLPRIEPAQARRGDVGYLGERLALSAPFIVVGAEAVSRNEDGWIVVPVAKLQTAFKVG